MTDRVFTASRVPLRGEVRVPGDKSLSHRAVLFASMAEGTSTLTGVLDSEDVRSTIEACRALGAVIEVGATRRGAFEAVRVTGWGAHGPRQPSSSLDCGNSGTTVRLLMGVLAGWPIHAVLTGDESLSRRPMLRVTRPLESMGARFETSDAGTLPVSLTGSDALTPTLYESPVASAQVKTAVLLAGLRACGVTRVTEPSLSRDHTERLLPAFGVPVIVDGAPGASVTGPATLAACDLAVPADPSSAAFLVVAALLVPGSEIVLPGVSLNATRTGFLEVLERMAADIEVIDRTEEGAEPVGTIVARYSPSLTCTSVSSAEVPSLVDEVPVLALAASRAAGVTRFEGVGELRVKESDRLNAIVDGLSGFGVSVAGAGESLVVEGPAALRGADVDSLGDHRLAMVWTIAGLIAEGETRVRRHDAVAVSYPGFVEDLASLAR